MLAIFDVEGVLFDAEYLPVLAEERGREDEIWEITRRGIEGTIDWEEGLRRRVELLRGIDYGTCERIAAALPIMTGARELCGALKGAGWRLMAVSGGFTIMTDRLKRELGLDVVLSNELVFQDNQLDGVRVKVGSDKAFAAAEAIAAMGERREDTVAIVDGANDIKLFDVCGLGIAFRAQDIVKERAGAVLEEKDLAGAIAVINGHYGLSLRAGGG